MKEPKVKHEIQEVRLFLPNEIYRQLKVIGAQLGMPIASRDGLIVGGMKWFLRQTADNQAQGVKGND